MNFPLFLIQNNEILSNFCKQVQESFEFILKKFETLNWVFSKITMENFNQILVWCAKFDNEFKNI